jgi:hypothetical protein
MKRTGRFGKRYIPENEKKEAYADVVEIVTGDVHSETFQMMPDEEFWRVMSQIDDMSNMRLTPNERLRLEMRTGRSKKKTVISGVSFLRSKKRAD